MLDGARRTHDLGAHLFDEGLGEDVVREVVQVVDDLFERLALVDEDQTGASWHRALLDGVAHLHTPLLQERREHRAEVAGRVVDATVDAGRGIAQADAALDRDERALVGLASRRPIVVLLAVDPHAGADGLGGHGALDDDPLGGWVDDEHSGGAGGACGADIDGDGVVVHRRGRYGRGVGTIGSLFKLPAAGLFDAIKPRVVDDDAAGDLLDAHEVQLVGHLHEALARHRRIAVALDDEIPKQRPVLDDALRVVLGLEAVLGLERVQRRRRRDHLGVAGRIDQAVGAALGEDRAAVDVDGDEADVDAVEGLDVEGLLHLRLQGLGQVCVELHRADGARGLGRRFLLRGLRRRFRCRLRCRLRCRRRRGRRRRRRGRRCQARQGQGHRQERRARQTVHRHLRRRSERPWSQQQQCSDERPHPVHFLIFAATL